MFYLIKFPFVNDLLGLRGCLLIGDSIEVI